MKDNFKKMVEQLNGESCYLCFIVNTLSREVDETGLARRLEKISVAWIPSISVPSKATLEGTKLIHFCRTTWIFRTIQLITCITLILLVTAILSSIQV